jgi:hypothetical protein
VVSASPEGEVRIPSFRRMIFTLIGLIVILLGLQILYVAVIVFVLPEGLFAGTDFDSDQMADLGNFGSSFGGVGAFFTGLGFAGIATTIYFQHRELSTHHRETQQQLQLQSIMTQSQTYQNATMTLYYLTQYFIEHPEDKPYFYSGKDFPRQDPDFTRLYTLAELFVDGMDDLIENRVAWPTWQRFFYDVYHTSPILRRYYTEHYDWYAQGLRDLLEGNRPP